MIEKHLGGITLIITGPTRDLHSATSACDDVCTICSIKPSTLYLSTPFSKMRLQLERGNWETVIVLHRT